MRIAKRSIGTLMLASTLLFTTSLPVNAIQISERVVQRRSTSLIPNEPVKLLTMKTLRKDRVEMDMAFTDYDDWFRGLAIQVENISKKKIVYVEIRVCFYRSKNQASEPPFVYDLSYGSRAKVTADLSGSAQIRPLIPGDIIDVTLSDLNYDLVQKALTKLKYPDSVERLGISVTEVIFDDDTAWSYGRLLRRNPLNGDEWIPNERE